MRVGEVADATGLTVRTLHYYDEIGLVSASQRTDKGYRLYTDGDLARLYRVVALRDLGLSLGEIADAMHADVDVGTIVDRQIASCRAEIERLGRLVNRLQAIGDRVDADADPDVDLLVETMEQMTMHEKYYTPDQLQRLEDRRRELGPEGMAAAEAEWAELIAAVEAERERGTPPEDPAVQTLARRWQELIEAFTGGEADIADSLANMYADAGAETASHGMLSPDTARYVAAAAEHRAGGVRDGSDS